MLKTINAEFQSSQLWFTDQNNRPLEIEDWVDIIKVQKICSRIWFFVICKKIW